MLILFSAGSAFADTWKVTADDTWNPLLPTSRQKKESTHTNADGKTITLFYAGINGDSFLLNKKSGNDKGSLTTEAIPGKITKITVKSGSNCSASATVNIYVGNTKIKENLKLSSRSTEYPTTVTIDNSNQTVKIETANANNVQISEVTITYDASLAKPTINLDNANKQFTISEISGGDIYYTVNQSFPATAADCTLAYTAAVPYETAEGTYYVHAYAKANDTTANSDSPVETVSYTVTGPERLAAPVITLDNASKSFTISAVENGEVYYCVITSETADATDCTLPYSAAVNYETAEGTYYVYAYAKATDTENFLDSDLATASYTVVDPSKQKVYSLVTDPSKLAVGDCFIVVYQSKTTYTALGKANENNFGNVDVDDMVSGSGDNRVITIPADATDVPTDITVEANTSSTSSDYPFLFKIANGYLHSVNGNNYLRASETVNESSPFAIANSNGKATIKNQAVSGNSSEIRYLRFNNSNKIFSCYKSSSSGMQDCYIYAIRDNKETAPLSWKDGIVTDVTLPYSVALTDLINNTENLEVSYSVAPESVLKIENGQLVALKEGTATLSVKYAGSETYRPLTLTKSFTVSKKESGIAWNETTEVTLNLNVATDVAEMISNPNNLTYTLTSSAPATIAVEGTVLTGKTEGTAQITIEYAGDDTYGTVKNQTRTFRVVNPNKQEAGLAWTVANPYSVMYESEAFAISSILQNPNSVAYSLTSSATNVISVDGENLVPGEMGSTELTATFAGDSNYNPQEIKLTVNVVADPEKSTVYTMLEDPTQLEPGQRFIMVGYVASTGKYYALGQQINPKDNGAKYRDAEEVTVNEINGVKTIAIPQGATVVPIRMLYHPNSTGYNYLLKDDAYQARANSGFMFVSPTKEGAQLSTSNSGGIQETEGSESRMKIEKYADSADKCHFTFNYNADNTSASQKTLLFNATSKRFSAYDKNSQQQDFYIFVCNSGAVTVDFTGGEEINGRLFGTTAITATVHVNGFFEDDKLYYKMVENGVPEEFVGNYDVDDAEYLGTERTFTITNPNPNSTYCVRVAATSDYGLTWDYRTRGTFKLDYVPVLDKLASIEELTGTYDDPEDADIKGYAMRFDNALFLPYAVNGSDLYVADDATERGHIKITNAPSSGEHGPNMIVEDLLCWYRADAKRHPYFDYIRATYNYDLYSTPPEAIETEFASYEAAPKNIYKYVTFKNIYVTSDGKLLADAPAASPARRAPAEGLVLNDIYGLLPGATTDNKVSEVAGFLEHFNGEYMFVPTKIGESTVSAELLPSEGAVVVAVYNLDGVKVNASDLATGIYIVRYSDGRTAKIVIRK